MQEAAAHGESGKILERCHSLEVLTGPSQSPEPTQK